MASAQFEKLVAYMAANPMPRVSRETSRETMKAFGANARRPEDVTLRDVDDAPVRARMLTPSDAESGLVLFAHGGGFTLGSIESHVHVAAWLAHCSRRQVLIFDYALAPERPFPAALEDYKAIHDWALAQGYASAEIVLAGDSAGANLGVSLAANGYVPRPGAIVALSPSFDLAGYLDIDPAANSDTTFDAGAIAEGFELYLGDTPADDPRASPNFANLAGLPPIFVQFSEGEVFAPGVLDFVEKARAAGVDIDVDMWSEMMHDWHWFAPRLPEALEALQRASDFIARTLK